MIELPKRSVTRFFIPLIDVLTLMFCIYLLMPIVAPTGDDEATDEPGRDAQPRDARLSALERKELDALRRQKLARIEQERLRQETSEMLDQLEKLRKDKLDVLQQRLAIRVLEIGEEGKLYYYDAKRAKERRVEITKETVEALLESQKQEAAGTELYFLILYPRVASGIPAFPLRSQREEYDRWFAGIAHGYDIPLRMRGME